MYKTIDIVVIAYGGEAIALKLQARSIRLFATPNVVGNIHIVINENNTEDFRLYFRKKIAPEYGDLINNVLLYDYDELTASTTSKTGWTSQQALKLVAAKLVSSPVYLILDSKNHFIRPLSSSLFFSQSGRIKMPLTFFHKPYEQYFNAAYQYFNGATSPNLDLALPTITPFLADTHTVMELIAEVEKRERKPFFSFFIESKQFREFYLYFAYIMACHGTLERLYENSLVNNVTYFHATESDETIEWLNWAIEQDYVYTLGVHRREGSSKSRL